MKWAVTGVFSGPRAWACTEPDVYGDVSQSFIRVMAGGAVWVKQNPPSIISLLLAWRQNDGVGFKRAGDEMRALSLSLFPALPLSSESQPPTHRKLLPFVIPQPLSRRRP